MENLFPALTLIRKFEGCKLNAYQDIVGVWTIGWGTTHGVTSGMQITQQEADQMLLEDCSKLSSSIRALAKTMLTDNQLCALISFTYNLGLGSFAHSTLMQKINSGSPKDDCAAEFLKWNHAGGKVVDGLTARRRAESELFLA
jgi:lysozyme